MNAGKIVDAILDREGPGVPPTYLAKNDAGGRTSWGISERAHPEEWKPGPPTKARAREILTQLYVAPFVPLASWGNDALIECLIDDATLSGADAAIKRLQWVIGAHVDGHIGTQTIELLKTQSLVRLITRYSKERVRRLVRIVQRRPEDLTNILGWVDRAMSFIPEDV